MSTNNFAKEKNILGKAMKALRKSNNMTLTEMSEVLGTSPGFLSEVERGLKMPGSSIIFSIKNNYPDIDLNNFFMEKNDEKIIKPSKISGDPQVRAYEQKIQEIVHGIEHGPFSQGLKVRLFDSFLHMIDEELDELHKQSDPSLSVDDKT